MTMPSTRCVRPDGAIAALFGHGCCEGAIANRVAGPSCATAPRARSPTRTRFKGSANRREVGGATAARAGLARKELEAPVREHLARGAGLLEDVASVREEELP